MKKLKSVFVVALISVILLLAWCPWVNENFVESRINSDNTKIKEHVYYLKRVPFGVESIVYCDGPGFVNGLIERSYYVYRVSFIGTTRMVYNSDLEKLKPRSKWIVKEELINAIKEKFPEVKDIHGYEDYEDEDYKKGSLRYIGRSQRIGVIVSDFNSCIIVFWKGAGDCPSGCMWNHWWYFQVTRDGNITKIFERGDPKRYID